MELAILGEYEKARQQKVAERRKESGYKTKKYHLFAMDIVRLNGLAKSMGYSTKKQLSNEEYSAIIRTCIAESYSRTFPEKTVKVPKTPAEQREYELKQIISYRAENGDSNEKIAKFLDQHKYIPPEDEETDGQSSEGQKSDSFNWTSKQVAKLKPRKKRGSSKF
ncbi:hypothetical protein ACUYOF_12170 [Photobacterium ganghwense]|uniref:hypothetical protein n=1 Tax=Photobacterium ganghwense TaxID=320778 RepID=UPI004056B4F6